MYFIIFFLILTNFVILVEQCLKSPDCGTNSDSSSSEPDGGLLQEVLSACGALGRHGKTGWVAVRADLDPKVSNVLIGILIL